MTKEEINKKTEEKRKKIQDLCKELQIVITAEEMINEDNIIKKVVYFIDTEPYQYDENKGVPFPYKT